MNKKSTSALVNEIAEKYLNGDALQKKKAMEKLQTVIYFNLRDFKIYFNEDTASDFLLYIYPNLENFIKQYNPERSVFFTFLCMKLQYYSMSFIRKKAKSARLQEAVIEEKTRNMSLYLEEKNNDGKYNFYVADCEVPYLAEKNLSDEIPNVLSFFKKKKQCKKIREERKRIFFLACKASLFLDDEMILKIAEYIDIPADFLNMCIKNLNLASKGIISRIEKVKRSRNESYIKKMICERRLSSGEIGDYEKSILQRSKRFSSAKFFNALQKSKKQIKSPSNRTIASILHVSRGTVDKYCKKI